MDNAEIRAIIGDLAEQISPAADADAVRHDSGDIRAAGLTSLELVELLTRVEGRFDMTISPLEGSRTRTWDDLAGLVARSTSAREPA